MICMVHLWWRIPGDKVKTQHPLPHTLRCSSPVLRILQLSLLSETPSISLLVVFLSFNHHLFDSLNQAPLQRQVFGLNQNRSRARRNGRQLLSLIREFNLLTPYCFFQRKKEGGRFRLLPFHCVAALAGTTSPLSHASNQLAWFTGSTENSHLLKRSIVRFRR